MKITGFVMLEGYGQPVTKCNRLFKAGRYEGKENALHREVYGTRQCSGFLLFFFLLPLTVDGGTINQVVTFTVRGGGSLQRCPVTPLLIAKMTNPLELTFLPYPTTFSPCNQSYFLSFLQKL